MESPTAPTTRSEIDVHAVHNELATSSSSAQQSPEPRFRTSQRTHTLQGISVGAIGTALPGRVVTNQELEEQHGMDSEWISRRTGIQERRYAAADETTCDLSVQAARQALETAGVAAADVDLLVVGTFTPDYQGPSTACQIQHELNLDTPAFDVSAACAGFIYSLVTAGQFVKSGCAKNALVIGADVVSRLCDPNNRKVAPLFGDGAGAAIVQPGREEQGFLCYQLGADGSGAPSLRCPAGGIAQPATPELVAQGQHFLHMDGRTVFKWAVHTVSTSIRTVLEQAGKTVDDVDLFVLHQANIRIIDHAMNDLGIPAEKVCTNLDRVGNTSAASIPLVLSEAQTDGRLKSGDLVMMSGFGAGLAWGTGLFRW